LIGGIKTFLENAFSCAYLKMVKNESFLILLLKLQFLFESFFMANLKKTIYFYHREDILVDLLVRFHRNGYSHMRNLFESTFKFFRESERPECIAFT